jgi:hypothetical protein
MTRRQAALVVLGGAVVLVAGLALGFALANRPAASPTPTPSVAAECQVTMSPATFRVDPVTGASSDILAFAGSGFPPNSAVSIDFAPNGAMLDYTSTASGDFSAEVRATVGTTHPAPPDIEAGSMTWTVTGWDGPEAPGQGAASVPPRACEVEVIATIELSAVASAEPPTDLVPGGYAEVLADGVRVRVEPSTESTVVGALFTGDVVRILTPAQVAEDLVWYQVESVVIQSGQQVRGYVAAGVGDTIYLRPTAEPPPPTPTPEATPSPSASPSP